MALHRLDDEDRNVLAPKRRLECLKIVEWDL